MNSCFRRNALLTDTALILLCNIRRVFVVSRSRRKLFSCQTYLHRIPERTLTLPLSQTHKCIGPEQQLNKVGWYNGSGRRRGRGSLKTR